MTRVHTWELIPNKSLGPVSLGEPMDAVRAKCGPFDSSFSKEFGDEDSFEDAVIHVAYGLQKAVTRIMVWHEGPPVVLIGAEVFTMTPSSFLDFCRNLHLPIWVKVRFGVEDADIWFLNEQGVAIMWTAENTIDWISLFTPGVYGHGPFVEVKELPEWAKG